MLLSLSNFIVDCDLENVEKKNVFSLIIFEYNSPNISLNVHNMAGRTRIATNYRFSNFRIEFNSLDMGSPELVVFPIQVDNLVNN